MLSIKQIYENDIDLCYELDSNTIALWSKKQWAKEFKKKGIKVFGILLSNLVIGICVFHVVCDEAQINFFVVNHKYRKKGFGTYLMDNLIKECENLNLSRLILEVSHNNSIADKFYSRFDFCTVGIRRNYYKDGSDALLKEKKLTSK
ncbi:ribosomal-protein-alanine acetyltransferase [Prochlorococcus marinus str. MU1402]|uniref:GNAT family N-acetyltransferase n=1 Tax=Prochlorococcus marinus TaxID=1219 RepID=UPI001ADD180B|nr:GNAT family N-acetyltransferase [Prochlorococcus marinus]MBO8232185.1 GNAT family N-acetyltransferase [Prochlorococcus marinus XMU1402]MBW3056921.1 ribosomal-protein-alanine acetyltransferase [Prochlorococcus marinus str. MU1402]